jgi:DNA-binding NtrC family response regulator
MAQRHAGMKVMYMTGYSGAAVLQQNDPSSRSVVLQKPFTPDSLLRAVRAALGTEAVSGARVTEPRP